MSAAEKLCGRGLGVALATPFVRGGGIDEPALAQLTRHVVDGGADFVVALGSTGEAAMLDEQERALVTATVRANCGDARLVVGTSASGTAQTCALTRAAHEQGAHAALVAAPPYVKPTQAGIVEHFRAVAAAAPELPLIAYNVPSRSAVGMTAATIRQLWQLPTVLAIKESSGDLQLAAHVAADLPADRLLLAGDDALLLPIVAVGGHGVVSVAGNVVPRELGELLDKSRAGDLPAARGALQRLLPLLDAMGLEPNPIGIKCALALAGIADAAPRLPLTIAAETTRDAIRQARHNLHEHATSNV